MTSSMPAPIKQAAAMDVRGMHLTWVTVGATPLRTTLAAVGMAAIAVSRPASTAPTSAVLGRATIARTPMLVKTPAAATALETHPTLETVGAMV